MKAVIYIHCWTTQRQETYIFNNFTTFSSLITSRLKSALYTHAVQCQHIFPLTLENKQKTSVCMNHIDTKY